MTGLTQKWIAMMQRGDRDSATQYDLRGDRPLLRTATGIPTMSFGYWRDVTPTEPDPLGAAMTAAFELAGSMAELGAEDTAVLDVGCGFGTFARHAVQRFGVQHVVGLNVSKFQMGYCQRLAAQSGLSSRLEFRLGSATDMPFPDASFDKVVSIEAAFHFPPRWRFLSEALRVLKPGGTLTVLDLVPLPPQTLVQRLQIRLLCRALQIPQENICEVPQYARQVAGAGFRIRELRSIREHTLPPYERWLRRQPLRKLLGVGAVLAVSAGSLYSYPLDYICLKATAGHPPGRKQTPCSQLPVHTGTQDLGEGS